MSEQNNNTAGWEVAPGYGFEKQPDPTSELQQLRYQLAELIEISRTDKAIIEQRKRESDNDLSVIRTLTKQLADANKRAEEAERAVDVLAKVAKAATSDSEENYYTNIRRAMMNLNATARAAVEKARAGQ